MSPDSEPSRRRDDPIRLLLRWIRAALAAVLERLRRLIDLTRWAWLWLPVRLVVLFASGLVLFGLTMWLLLRLDSFELVRPTYMVNATTEALELVADDHGRRWDVSGATAWLGYEEEEARARGTLEWACGARISIERVDEGPLWIQGTAGGADSRVAFLYDERDDLRAVVEDQIILRLDTPTSDHRARPGARFPLSGTIEIGAEIGSGNARDGATLRSGEISVLATPALGGRLAFLCGEHGRSCAPYHVKDVKVVAGDYLVSDTPPPSCDAVVAADRSAVDVDRRSAGFLVVGAAAGMELVARLSARSMKVIRFRGSSYEVRVDWFDVIRNDLIVQSLGIAGAVVVAVITGLAQLYDLAQALGSRNDSTKDRGEPLGPVSAEES